MSNPVLLTRLLILTPNKQYDGRISSLSAREEELIIETCTGAAGQPCLIPNAKNQFQDNTSRSKRTVD